MVRQKRKEENRKKRGREGEGESEKKMERDGVLQGHAGVILRH